MKKKINYIEINRKMWNLTAAVYQKDGFSEALKRVNDGNFSTFDETEKKIFETQISVNKKRIIQIGCNNGIEIIYLKKLGAERCVGLDISSEFIVQAKQLALASEQIVEFICDDIFKIHEDFYEQFDIVYITVGVIGLFLE
jgi:2-polyprenyl-3-methyl-5-hydroxy-6-metoxy-1,4-benzoquinol methylase